VARYFEDFAAGDTFVSPARTVTLDEIRDFARAYDPQPFHVDEVAAAASFFGRLVASGWHTAALTMRLLTESELDVAGGLIGAGMEELRWPNPLLPGDTIRVELEVVEVRASRSRPSVGIVRLRMCTVREDGTPVQTQIASLMVPRRIG
jgi:acyl dehydratase